MAKEIMLLSTDEIINGLVASAPALEAYRFALANAGIEMDEGAQADFIVHRNQKSGWIELWEFRAWLKKTLESVETVVKHAFNVGTADELPKNVKWSKQSFTSTFSDPMTAAKRLIEIEGTPVENFLQWITPKQAAEAAGITEDRLRSDLGDMIVDTPKARTLSIK